MNLNVIGLLLAMLVLMACRQGSSIEGSAVFLFALAILLLIVGTNKIIREGYRAHGMVMAILITALLIASLMPWYVPHYVPWNGGSTHRHSIWELGHVH